MKTKIPTVWVIADTHFGHSALVEKLGTRPAGFEDRILDALTVAVKPGDLVIHLGDFSIGEDARWAEAFRLATEGATRVLVRGNHDSKSNSWYRERGFAFVCEAFMDRYYGKRITFSHVPFGPEVMGAADHLNVHGHTHGNAHRGDFKTPYHVEVACETLGYGPVSLKKLLNV